MLGAAAGAVSESLKASASRATTRSSGALKGYESDATGSMPMAVAPPSARSAARTERICSSQPRQRQMLLAARPRK